MARRLAAAGLSEPLALSLLPGTLAICRLDASEPIPRWAGSGPLQAAVRTADELALICGAEAVPAGVPCQAAWRALRVEGPLDFTLIGVLAALAGVLAEAGVPILALSTFDTDYVLVPDARLESALAALKGAGYRVPLPQ